MKKYQFILLLLMPLLFFSSISMAKDQNQKICAIETGLFDPKVDIQIARYYEARLKQYRSENQLGELIWKDLTKDCQHHFTDRQQGELALLITEELIKSRLYTKLKPATFVEFLKVKQTTSNRTDLISYFNLYIETNSAEAQYNQLENSLINNTIEEVNIQLLATLALSKNLSQSKANGLISKSMEYINKDTILEVLPIYGAFVTQYPSKQIKQLFTSALVNQLFNEQDNNRAFKKANLKKILSHNNVYPANIVNEQVLAFFSLKNNRNTKQWQKLTSIIDPLNLSSSALIQLNTMRLKQLNSINTLKDREWILSDLLNPLTDMTLSIIQIDELSLNEELLTELLNEYVKLWKKQPINKTSQLWRFYHTITTWMTRQNSLDKVLSQHINTLDTKLSELIKGKKHQDFSQYIQLLVLKSKRLNNKKHSIISALKQHALQIIDKHQYRGYKAISLPLLQFTNHNELGFDKAQRAQIFSEIMLTKLTDKIIKQELINQLQSKPQSKNKGVKQASIVQFPLTVWLKPSDDNLQRSYYKIFYDFIRQPDNENKIPWLFIYYAVKASMNKNDCLWKTDPNSRFYTKVQPLAHDYPLIWIKILDNKQPFCSYENQFQADSSQLETVITYVTENFDAINAQIKLDTNKKFQQHLAGVGRAIKQTEALIYWLNSATSVYEWLQKGLLKQHKIIVNHDDAEYPITISSNNNLDGINPAQFETSIRRETLELLLSKFDQNEQLKRTRTIDAIAMYALSLPIKIKSKQNDNPHIEILKNCFKVLIEYLQQHFQQEGEWSQEIINGLYTALKLKGHIQPDIHFEDIAKISISKTEPATYQERNIQAAIISLIYPTTNPNELKASIDKRFELLTVPTYSYYNYLPFQVSNLKWLLTSINGLSDSASCEQTKSCKSHYRKRLYIKAKRTVDLQINDTKNHSTIDNQERLVCTLFWLKSNKEKFNNDYTNRFLDINAETFSLLYQYLQQQQINNNQQSWLDREFDCQAKMGQYFAKNGLMVLQQSALNNQNLITSNQLFGSVGEAFDTILNHPKAVRSDACAMALFSQGIENCTELVDIPTKVYGTTSFLTALKLSVTKDWKEHPTIKIKWTQTLRKILALTQSSEVTLKILLELGSLESTAQERVISLGAPEVYAILHRNFEPLTTTKLQRTTISTMLSNWRNSYLQNGVIQALIADNMPAMIEGLIKGHSSYTLKSISCNSCIWRPVYKMQSIITAKAIDPPYPQAFMDLTQWWHKQNQPYCDFTGYNKLFKRPLVAKKCQAQRSLANKDTP